MKEIRHLKTIKKKKKMNLQPKRYLLQNNQNADTTLLHLHDDKALVYITIPMNILTTDI